MSWEEDDASVTHHRMMQMQFAEECIETKTVTTTTTTKRSYPPLFVRAPRDLHSLDSKEYPLASRPTPPELRRLTFDLGEGEDNAWNCEEESDFRVSSFPEHENVYASVSNLPNTRSAGPRAAIVLRI
jgi:F-box and WD-40 domain protein CDC4